MLTLADITSDTATLEDFVKQVEQQQAENIFADLEEYRGTGKYSEVYCLLATSVEKLKKKYGVK